MVDQADWVLPTSVQRGVRRPRLVDVVAIVTGLVSLIIGTAASIQNSLDTWPPFEDWLTYSRAVDRWLHGEGIYAPAQLHGPYDLVSMTLVGYAYPPASVPLFLPFASFPVGLMLWELLVVGVFLSGLWAIALRTMPPRRVPVAFGIAMLVAGLFRPVTEGIGAGNVNILTAGMLALVWARVPFVVAATGVLTAVKLFPLALVAPMGWRAVAKAGAIAIAAFVLTLPFVGVQAWRDFVLAVADAQPRCADYAINRSIACTVGPVVGLPAVKVISLAIAGMAAVVAIRKGPTLLGCTAVAVAIMAPASDLHLHYWSLVFVLALIAVADLVGRRVVLHDSGSRQAPPLSIRGNAELPDLISVSLAAHGRLADAVDAHPKSQRRRR